MTDLLDVLPSFPTAKYTHLLPSLEKNFVTTSDLLTLEGIEVAKRAQLPLLDVKRLIAHVSASLQTQLGVGSPQNLVGDGKKFEDIPSEGEEGWGKLKTEGDDLLSRPWKTISLGDEVLDEEIGGGVPTGYITEFVGESGSAKTQILLVLLLLSQLPAPHGLNRPSLYISTEHSLPTSRLTQLLKSHPLLSSLAPNKRPSLSNILSISTPDLESQDHIINYQLPVALSRHKIGLVVIDSIAANYRAEKTSTSSATTGKGSRAEMLADRNAQLIILGAQLRKLAREHDCAIVVANQVSDRFNPLPPPFPSLSTGGGTHHLSEIANLSSSPAASPSSQMMPPSSAGPMPPPPPQVLSLDHQLRWFSGWGDDPAGLFLSGGGEVKGEKTPAMGLAWANQIDCRIAVLKEQQFGENEVGEAEWAPRRWARSMRCVFSGWALPTVEGNKGAEFEIWEGGIRALKKESGSVAVESGTYSRI